MNKTPFLILLAAAFAPAVFAATSVTQFGITWTFDKPQKIGQYITGDWWVVGPVTVKSVTPAPITADDPKDWRNGSMVNPPAGVHVGYDGRLHFFETSLWAEFPLDLKPGDSLVSTASFDDLKDTTPDVLPENAAPAAPLRTATVLTCVAEPPPADAFRPAFSGTWKEQFTVSQIRRDLLPSLAVPEGLSESDLPNLAELERKLERVWLDNQQEWVSRNLHPRENMPGYGREISWTTISAALLLAFEDPQKERETLLLRYIQRGIDYYGITQSHDNLWTPNGGHNHGRKLPILVAGKLLGHEGMLNVKATFQEDAMTYYARCWTGAKVCAQGTHEEKPPEEWTADGRGKPGDPERVGAGSDFRAEAYRKQNGSQFASTALAAWIFNVVEAWNHPPFFDYADRWMTEDYPPLLERKQKAADSEGLARAISHGHTRQGWAGSKFTQALWEKYRPKFQPAPDRWKGGDPLPIPEETK